LTEIREQIKGIGPGRIQTTSGEVKKKQNEGPSIHVGVTLTHTTHLNIVADNLKHHWTEKASSCQIQHMQTTVKSFFKKNGHSVKLVFNAVL